MRLKLVPAETRWNFLSYTRFAVPASLLAMAASVVLTAVVGLNFGIDFRGGTVIRTQSTTPVDIGVYRDAVTRLGLGDISITNVNDPTFAIDQHVALLRISVQQGDESIASTTVNQVQDALRSIDPAIVFPLVESVGPKVSGELIQKAIIAVIAAIVAVLIYIWLRFEWQFSLGAVAALIHDVLLTLGLFSLLQIKFDLAIIAALLTIVGYSLNDTVVVYDRVREQLKRYRKRPLVDVLNLALNLTLSRTVVTSFTTLLALLSLFVFGGDVIRGFVFAMIWGVLVGTYSSVFIATYALQKIGVKRDWTKAKDTMGTKFSSGNGDG